MTMSHFFINIISFCSFCLVGSLSMCGLYKVTRKGMLLGFWSEWWEATTDYAKTLQSQYETEKELKDLALEARNRSDIQEYGSLLNQTLFKINLIKKAKRWYKRPAGLVHPLSGCVYCYASLYGSVIYWLAGYAFVKISDGDIRFSWHLIVLWIVYMFCTSALNGILIKKVL